MISSVQPYLKKTDLENFSDSLTDIRSPRNRAYNVPREVPIGEMFNFENLFAIYLYVISREWKAMG